MKQQGLQPFHNFILIAGTGRNVGKTLLACDIIRELSSGMEVTAVKISNHFHPIENGQKRLADNPRYQIIEESINSDKDSARMRKAGAKVSYYIQSHQENLYEAVMHLHAELKNGPVVCESGGLHHFIMPGLFFLVEGNAIPDNKISAYMFDPIRVKLNAGQFNINVKEIRFKNNAFTYKNHNNEYIF